MITGILGNPLERTERGSPSATNISLPTEGDGQNHIRKAKTVLGFTGKK
jgi:hypothetical protein